MKCFTELKSSIDPRVKNNSNVKIQIKTIIHLKGRVILYIKILILKASKRSWSDLCTVYSARWVAFTTAKEPHQPPHQPMHQFYHRNQENKIKTAIQALEYSGVNSVIRTQNLLVMNRARYLSVTEPLEAIQIRAIDQVQKRTARS